MSRADRNQPARLTGPLPPPEIVEMPRVPRVQLVVVFLVDSDANPARVAVSTAHFVSAVLTADPGLRLKVDPVRSSACVEEVDLVLTPAVCRSDTSERLTKLIGVVREEIVKLEGARLVRAEVVSAAGRKTENPDPSGAGSGQR